MEICFPSSPAPVFVFGIWRRGMYNTEIIYRTTSNLNSIFFRPLLFCFFFNLNLFFPTPFYSFFLFSFSRGIPAQHPLAEVQPGVPAPTVPAGETCRSAAPSPTRGKGMLIFPPLFPPAPAGRGGCAELPGRSRCWPLSLRGVSEHYASLPSCLRLAGDDLEGRAWQRRSQIRLRQTDLSAGRHRSAASAGRP